MGCHLIVLSGEAGAGKDSVAKVLVDKHGYVAYSLAAPLKAFAKDMFGFTDEQLYGPSRCRNEPDPRWARPCPLCRGEGKIPYIHNLLPRQMCDTCKGMGKLNDNSPRRVLQLLGEEYLRQMVHPDALTMRAEGELVKMMGQMRGWPPPHGGIVVNDARNANDRDNLHAWLGAVRVDVRAPGKESDGAEWRKHSSELSRPTDDQVEHVIVNDEEYPFPALEGKVAALLEKLG